MKRWAIRLSTLTAVVALGWFTVAWAQRQTTEEPGQGPDFSKPAVNADAVGLTSRGGNSTAMSGNTVTPVAVSPAAANNASVDPFQGAAKLANDRYRTEPQQFQPDPNAAALATDTSEIATKQAAHNEPDNRYATVQDVGSGDPNASKPAGNAANDPVKPFDPFGSNRGSATSNNATVNSDAGQMGALQTPNNTGADQQRGAEPQYGQYGQSQAGSAAAGNGGDKYGAAQATNGGAADAAPLPPSYGGMQSSNGGSSRDNNYNYNYNDTAPPAGNNYRQNPSMENIPGATLGSGANQQSQNGGNYGQDFANNPRNDNYLPPRGTQNGMAAGNDPYANSGRAMPTGADAYGAPPTPPANVEGYGRPGDKKLEGAQSPSVTIQKIAPPEIKVGKAAKIEIVVRNTGPVVAENVEVIESVPQGTTLISTNPQTQMGPRNEIVWKVGELKPAEEAKLQVELMPVAEGEIGSVAVVQFRSQASMRTIATKPELVLELNSPKQVMIGGDVTVGIKISNPGTGAAEKIVLHSMVPPGFQHQAGSELEFEVGTLKPGESRELPLVLHAVQAGAFTNTVTVTGDANLRAEQPSQIQVIAPALEVAINGPGLRYLERQAKYNVSVNNPGTAPAKNIELVTRLPKGMQFVDASDMGHYDKNSHSVIWSLLELPAGQAGSVTLTALAAEAGEQKLRGEGRATGGLSHTTEATTLVEGVAAVLFTVVDVDDPVEVSGQAVYEIKVVNQGSKAASRVMVEAILPQELKPVSAEGPSQHRIDSQRVTFEPMTRLAPKADITYRIVAQAVSPGDSRIKVLLKTEDMTEPVTKEESTRVYRD